MRRSRWHRAQRSRSHALWSSITTDDPRRHVINQIRIVTGRDVSMLLRNQPTGLVDDARYYYVQLRGRFIVPQSQGQARIYRNAFEVFDINAGYLMLSHCW